MAAKLQRGTESMKSNVCLRAHKAGRQKNIGMAANTKVHM